MRNTLTYEEFAIEFSNMLSEDIKEEYEGYKVVVFPLDELLTF